MAKVFTRKKVQECRRYLRKNMTKAEIRLWIQLQKKQILGERFLRQYSVGNFTLDFYSPKLKLAIEVDGDSHFVKGAEAYDREQQEFIESFGIQFLRFTNTDVYESLEGVVEEITMCVQQLKTKERS